MRLIPLRNRRGEVVAHAKVDDADHAWLSAWRWCLHANGYAIRGGQTADRRHRTVFMHREILPPPAGRFIDHADGDKLNNQRVNLRVCSKSENMTNQRLTARNRSGFVGVSRRAGTDHWLAYIRKDNVARLIGVFTTREAAASAYAVAAQQLHGEFASPAAEIIDRDYESKRVRPGVQVTAFGETKNIAEWSRDPRCLVSEVALMKRLRRAKWKNRVEEAIALPASRRGEAVGA